MVSRCELVFLVLWSVATFTFILPVTVHQLEHSYYYRDQDEEVGEQDTVQLVANAAKYVRTTVTSSKSDRYFLVITVVTVRRPGGYLSQVVTKLNKIIGNDSNAYQVLICNVDADAEMHQEARTLTELYPNVIRIDRYYSKKSLHHHQLSRHRADRKINIFEKEKDDYVFCLNATLDMRTGSHFLVLEDDALPHDDLLFMTSYLVRYRLAKDAEDLYYVKLYHPERLQGYFQPEPWRIAEWLAISILGSMATTTSASFFRPSHIQRSNRISRFIYFIGWMLYWMCLLEAIGRTHLLELRRASPHLYNVLEATECCTPAMYWKIFC